MNNINNTKKLTNSALLVSLLVIFALLGSLPFFSLISLSVGPIIVALIFHRAGKFYTGLSFVVTMVLLTILMNPIYALTMTVLTFTIGAGLIYMIAKNHSALVNFVVLTLAIVVGYLIMTYVEITLISQVSLMEIFSTLVEQFKLSMAETAKIIEQAGGSQSTNPAIIMFQNLTVTSFLNILPTIVTVYAIITAIIIYKVAYIIFKRVNIEIKPLPVLSEIKTNMILVLVTLVIAMVGVILVYFGVTQAEGIMLLGYNLFILVGVVGGVSLLSYFLKNKLKYPTIFRIVILILVMASSLISIVMIAGVIDSAFDFRKLRENGLYKMLKSKMDNIK